MYSRVSARRREKKARIDRVAQTGTPHKLRLMPKFECRMNFAEKDGPLTEFLNYCDMIPPLFDGRGVK